MLDGPAVRVWEVDVKLGEVTAAMPGCLEEDVEACGRDES